MELSDLQHAWKGLEDTLSAQRRELLQLRRQRGMDGIRARLRGISRGQAWQCAIGVLLVLWAGGYWWDRLGQPHLVAYGLALHAYGIALLGLACAQLVVLSRIAYDGPVLAVQRSLLELRRQRARHERWLLVAGMLAWAPMLFVVLRGLGMDVYLQRPAVVWWNLALAAALAVLVAWWTGRDPARFERGAAGAELVAAEAELAALEDDAP